MQVRYIYLFSALYEIQFVVDSGFCKMSFLYIIQYVGFYLTSLLSSGWSNSSFRIHFIIYSEFQQAYIKYYVDEQLYNWIYMCYLFYGYIGTALAALTFIILVIRFCIETFAIQKNAWDSSYIQQFVSFLIISITLLVVAVPEGLPLAVILALAYSIKVGYYYHPSSIYNVIMKAIPSDCNCIF